MAGSRKKTRGEENLGMRFLQARLKAEMTQEQVAGKLGISRVAISSLENGNLNLRAVLLAKAAKMFGTTVEWLLGG